MKDLSTQCLQIWINELDAETRYTYEYLLSLTISLNSLAGYYIREVYCSAFETQKTEASNQSGKVAATENTKRDDATQIQGLAGNSGGVEHDAVHPFEAAGICGNKPSSTAQKAITDCFSAAALRSSRFSHFSAAARRRSSRKLTTKAAKFRTNGFCASISRFRRRNDLCSFDQRVISGSGA
jgi:hypothetical protein